MRRRIEGRALPCPALLRSGLAAGRCCCWHGCPMAAELLRCPPLFWPCPRSCHNSLNALDTWTSPGRLGRAAPFGPGAGW